MQFNDYQDRAAKFAIYPTLGQPIVYPALGLNGEAGEVAEKVKKLVRDTDGTITEDFRKAICKELGDALWYISETARQAGLSLEDVAAGNLAKLDERLNNGTINGSGDNR
jgi:NTP pyrophosphatase (non-canonical NTP hydrolase)